jgi:hypothetical protein
VDDVRPWLSIHHIVVALLHPLPVDDDVGYYSSSPPWHRREVVESLASLPLRKKTSALERNQRKQEHLREERHAAACGLVIFP